MSPEIEPTFAEALRDYGLATLAFEANPCPETADELKIACERFVAAERRRAAERLAEDSIKVVVPSHINPNDGWS
jgi:hypothetical protein